MQYIYFWHEYEQDGEFSNWYMSDFIVDDLVYNCAEQYMMAEKARIFHDAARRTAILKETDPHKMKHLGKQVQGFNSATWNSIKEYVMLTALRAKFSQNAALREKLLATGSATLVEASPYDEIWGIKMHAAEAAIVDESQWKGQNLLGKCLMTVRDELN